MPAREASVFFCVLYHVVSTLELLDIGLVGLAGRLTQMRAAANCLRRALLTRPVLKSVSKSGAQLVASRCHVLDISRLLLPSWQWHVLGSSRVRAA